MTVEQEILINVTAGETRVAFIENAVVQDLHIERRLAPSLVGNIYMGKVVRVLPGMQAAFVDIGLDKNGFLHAADIPKVGIDPASGNTSAIQSLVHQGERVLVQVVKDPKGNKGVRLTAELSFPSRYLVYLPYANGIGVSNKITDPQLRARLKALLQSQLEQLSLAGGIIIRTRAESAAERDIKHELEFLQQQWALASKSARGASSGTFIHTDMPLLLRTLRDLVSDDVKLIRIDTNESYHKALEFAANYSPSMAEKIDLYLGEQPLFNVYSIERQIEAALHRKVKLASGGNLIFDQTEAMHTIDVNTASYVGRSDNADTVLELNLEAATEIAPQIRLRNLSGIIVIDFIDMANNEHQQQVLNALQIGLRRDQVETNITSVSQLNLVVLTRKRSGECLAQMMCDDCSACDGHGIVKSTQTISYEILREIQQHHFQYKSLVYTVKAAAGVIERLGDQEADYLAEIQARIGSRIDLQVGQDYQQQQYDIVLASL